MSFRMSVSSVPAHPPPKRRSWRSSRSATATNSPTTRSAWSLESASSDSDVGLASPARPRAVRPPEGLAKKIRHLGDATLPDQWL
jgi:hypothetical protein